jgi:hypothetical protein
MVLTCDSRCLVGRGRRVKVRGQPGENYVIVYEKQTKSKQDWGHGSSDGALA